MGTQGVAQERGEESGATGQVSLLDSCAGSSRGRPPSKALALVYTEVSLVLITSEHNAAPSP